jgi:hypothetical protein
MEEDKEGLKEPAEERNCPQIYLTSTGNIFRSTLFLSLSDNMGLAIET